MGGLAGPLAAPSPLAVAVSGGGDSVALMLLLRDLAWTHALPPPTVLTVNHGLRKESAAEARQVVAWARAASLEAHILTWRGPKPDRGLEAAAREARYRLMGNWLKKQGIASLLVGHTRDDQAETFLLRLARGSGLDGLAAMQAEAPWPLPGFDALRLHRPLLGLERDDLRAWLAQLGQPWLEDPMNQDSAFDRVKVRQARAALSEAGLSAARIAAAAAHLARARAALEIVTDAVLARAVRTAETGLLLDPAALAAAPREIGLRALAAILRQVAGQPYRPRFEALERLFDRIAGDKLGGGATLHGCRIGPARRRERVFGPGTLSLMREGRRKTVRPGVAGTRP